MNPYEVLGVSESASDEEVKSAYRTLVKKFHPDKFANDPKKQAAASEKLKQINAAYDMITKYKQGNFSGGGSPKYNEIRMAIQRNDIGTAETLLNQMQERSAEWHYLMGIVLMRRGWYDGAHNHFTQAHNMDPSNKEYENAMTSMNQAAGGYGDINMSGINLTSPICKICAVCACAGCIGSNFMCRAFWCC